MAESWKVTSGPAVEPVTLAQARLHLRVGGIGATATSITKANPGVVTANSHGLATGDVVTWTVAAGMVELDGVATTVTYVSDDTFSIGVDTSGYTTSDGTEAYWPDHADDDRIAAMISAAREMVENDANRALITQTITLTLDVFPVNLIEMPHAPLQSITSIIYNDSAGDSQTVTASDYVVDTSAEPGRIALASGASWPSVYGEIGDVVITLVAGYGDAASDVPDTAKQAMLLAIALEYEQYDTLIEKQVQDAYDRQVRRLWVPEYA